MLVEPPSGLSNGRMLDCGNQYSGPTDSSALHRPSEGKIVGLGCTGREYHVGSAAPDQCSNVFTGFINRNVLDDRAPRRSTRRTQRQSASVIG